VSESYQPNRSLVQVGADVHGILLWPLGGLAFVGHSTSPKTDIFVSVSGPLTHIPQFGIWFAILAISASVVYHGTWKPSLSVPDPHYHFWLAVCAGASQVHQRPCKRQWLSPCESAMKCKTFP
jgi:hypothetical protein